MVKAKSLLSEKVFPILHSGIPIPQYFVCIATITGNLFAFSLMTTHAWGITLNSSQEGEQLQANYEENQGNYLRTTSVLPLSEGDKVRIIIPGVGGEEFSGDYQVDLHGNLDVPFLQPFSVSGLNTEQVEDKLSRILIEQQFFLPDLLDVSLQVLEFAPVRITVKGDVFEPGSITINEISEGSLQSATSQIPGDNPLGRYLTASLKLAGGIRPTASLSEVKVFREGRLLKTVDLSGIFSADPIQDIPLIAGDHVVVESSGYFQSELVRPSPITPSNIPLYVSNLSEPAGGRVLQSSGASNTTDFNYGVRLSQVLFSAQCLGGDFVNKDRQALLVRVNPELQEAEFFQFGVEETVRQTLTSEEVNPLLMPNDGVACYDSSLTSSSSFLNLIGTFLNPFNSLGNILESFKNVFFNNR